MIFEALMTALLAWQIWMPAVDNGKFMFQIDKDGTIIKMNTQNGTMERCSSDLKCSMENDQAQKRIEDLN